MRITILSSVHKHNDIRIFQKEARSLVKAGHEVFFINKDVSKKEDGITFIKADVSSKRLSRILFGPSKMYKAALTTNADVYHFHDPELKAIATKLLKRGKVIYDSHEDTPRQILDKYYLPKFLRKISSKLFERDEKKRAKKFDAVITATDTIRDVFVKNGITNVVTVNNYPILDEFENIDCSFSKKSDIVIYAGGLERIRGISEICAAAPKTPCKIKIAGLFSDPVFENECKKSVKDGNPEFLGMLGRKDLVTLLESAKAGLVLFKPIENHINSMPNKIFEYMAAGIPVIASDFPLWKRIIEENKCGICVNPDDPDKIAKAITYIVENNEEATLMGERGRGMVNTKYNWATQEETLIKLYSELDNKN